MQTINQIQDDIIEEFLSFEEWMDKYEYLIDLGKNLPMIDPEDRNDQNLIVGCQSKVWLSAKYENGMIKFSADSDAIITKGIIALLIRILNHRTAQEIVDAQLYFIDKIGLNQNLSPTRANGLVAMVKQMKMYALAYQQIKQ